MYYTPAAVEILGFEGDKFWAPVTAELLRYPKRGEYPPEGLTKTLGTRGGSAGFDLHNFWPPR
jgi:hypothetical protein